MKPVNEDVQIELLDTENDSIQVLQFMSADGKVILKQDWWVE